MAKNIQKSTFTAQAKVKAEAEVAPVVNVKKGFSLLSFRVQSVILVLLCLVLYFNTFNHEAAFDDRMAITANEYVQAGVAGIPDILTKDAYQSYLEQRQGGNQLAGGRYRPLSLITFAIEQQIMGVAPEHEKSAEKELRIAEEMHTRHVINVLLYALCVVTLLYFLRTVVFPEQPILAFMAALLFTIHPIHTEVVANVKSRDEILSVLFISLTFIKALQYYDNKKTRDLILALVCFFCALLSKEYAITLVLLLPLSFYVFRKVEVMVSLKKMAPYCIPLALYLILRMASVTAAAEGAEMNVMNNPYLFATGMQKIASEFYVLLQYLKLLFLPITLCSDYSYHQLPYSNIGDPAVLLSFLAYGGLAVVMIRLIIRRHVVGFALAFFLFNLVLVSNIFFNIGAPMGERLVFHSSVGFAIMVAWLLVKGMGAIKHGIAANYLTGGTALLLIVLSGFKTIDRNAAWKNDETLFMTDVKTAPNSALVNNNAAASCMNNAKKNRENKALKDEWFGKAIGYFDKAIAINPQHMLSYLNRGVCYYNMGNAERAVQDWDTVRKYEPKKPDLAKYMATAASMFYNKALSYGRDNKPDSAIYAFKLSADISSERTEPWYYLANAYFVAGRNAEARAALDKALKLAPNYTEARRLNDEMLKQKAQ